MPVNRSKAHSRAAQLIALATDDASTLEERRSAALAAAKLIDEHDLLGVEQDEPSPDEPPIVTPQQAQDVVRVIADIFSSVRKRSRKR